MGVFGSRRRTYVGTTVSRAIPDAFLPDAVRVGTNKAIFSRRSDTSISEHVMDESIQSLGARAERMFVYARDHYTHGLPSGRFISASQGQTELQTVLDALEGTSTTIEYYHFGPGNALHRAWLYLIETLGYNLTTNELAVLSASNGFTTYLEDIEVVVPESFLSSYRPGMLAQWGPPARAGISPTRPATGGTAAGLRLSHTPLNVSPTATDESLRIYYSWINASGDVQTNSLSVDLDSLIDPSADYFHARYLVPNTTPGYWSAEHKDPDVTLSDGGFLATITSGGLLDGTVRGIDGRDAAGDYSFEVDVSFTDGTGFWRSMVGIITPFATLSQYPGYDSQGYGYWANSGNLYHANTGFGVPYGTSYPSGTTITVRISGGTLRFYRNGVPQAIAATGLTGIWFPAWSPGSSAAGTRSGRIRTSGLLYLPAGSQEWAATAGATPKVIMYRRGAGTYPSLDDVFSDSPSTSGTYFPFGYFRFNGVSETANPTSQSYITTKRMMRRVGIDIDMLTEAIEENPDISFVQQAMLTFAVPANSSDQLELRYLFQYFKNLHNALPEEERIRFIPGASPYSKPGMRAYSQVIADTRFSMSVNYDGIGRRLVAGSIGPVGTFAGGTFDYPVEETSTYGESEITTTITVTYTGRSYKRQITTGLYEELLVTGLEVQYNIFDGRFTIGDEEDPIFLIPIDRSITQNWSMQKRERLYARSMHYVFNSVQTVKVKWYQTTLFQFIVIVALMYITVLTQGATAEALATAIAAGSSAAIWAALQAILVSMVYSYAISRGLQLFVKEVGGDFAMALAVLAAFYAAWTSFNTGSLTNTPWAEELLKGATNLLQATGKFYASELSDLSGQRDAFNVLRDQKMDELEAANKLLENNNWLAPLVVFGEKPEDFYNRTVHSGNVGVLGLDAISTFADVALQLPSVSETLNLGESS